MKRLYLLLLPFTILLAPAQNASAQDSITIRAAIIYEMGGAQPVASTEFMLLDQDPAQVLAERFDLPFPRQSKPGEIAPLKSKADLDVERGQRLLGDRNMLESAREGDKPYGENVYRSSRIALKLASVATGKTDHEGRLTFEEVEPGTYWIFGITTTRAEENVLWSKKIRPSDEILKLDQHNAALID